MRNGTPRGLRLRGFQLVAKVECAVGILRDRNVTDGCVKSRVYNVTSHMCNVKSQMCNVTCGDGEELIDTFRVTQTSHHYTPRVAQTRYHYTLHATQTSHHYTPRVTQMSHHYNPRVTHMSHHYF
jgi:hypothetical protein